MTNKLSRIDLINVYDNPNEEDERFTIVFEVNNEEIWEIVASEDAEVFFAMDITTADDWDKGKEIKFDELPEIVKEKVLLEWKDWYSSEA
jgi:hypothetical protein